MNRPDELITVIEDICRPDPRVQDVSGWGPEEARWLGKEAYRRGICRCPYLGGTMSHHHWWAGWRAEQALSGEE